MSFFVRKNEQFCFQEIETVSEYIRQIFNTEINLIRFKDQIDGLIEDKIAEYNHQRFRDWTVADLIMMSKVLDTRIKAERVEELAEITAQRVKRGRPPKKD